MKYIYTLISMAIVSFVIISINPQTGHSNSTGAPQGRTGAMGEGTCGDAGCHGTAPANAPNAITTDIPTAGYTPGQTYNITVTASEMGRMRFGFQARSSAGSLNGNNDVQLVGGGTYATHRTGSTSGTDSRAWTFEWTAPTAGTGTVTFNTAMLAANGNGSTSGDNVYTSSLQVSEASTNNVVNVDAADITVYPSPFTNTITLEQGTNAFENASISIYSLDGKKVVEKEMTSTSVSFDTQNFAKGIYIIKLQAGTTIVTKKVAKM